MICKRILEKKKFIVNQGVEKKFHDQTKSPTPSPPHPPLEDKWSAPKDNETSDDTGQRFKYAETVFAFKQIKANDNTFVVLFIMLYKVLLLLSLWMKSLSVTIQFSSGQSIQY